MAVASALRTLMSVDLMFMHHCVSYAVCVPGICKQALVPSLAHHVLRYDPNLTTIFGNLTRQAGFKSLIRECFKPASDVLMSLSQWHSIWRAILLFAFEPPHREFSK
jgi:hypothetical protein